MDDGGAPRDGDEAQDNSGEISEDVIKFADNLEIQIKSILEKDFGFKVIDGLTIDRHVVLDVAIRVEMAMKDMRNIFKSTISMLKYIGNAAFWVLKLKPINTNTLLKDGKIVSSKQINERVALAYSLKSVYNAILQDNLREIVTADEFQENSDFRKKFNKLIQFYLVNNVYRNSETLVPKAGSQKFNETAYNFRYKKISAVNIYEMLTHMVLVCKV